MVKVKKKIWENINGYIFLVEKSGLKGLRNRVEIRLNI